MDGPGDEVRQAERELIAAEAVASGTRKRKAGDDSTDDRREHTNGSVLLRRERSRPRARRNVSTIDLRRNLK
jgi:hypothetical protein